MLDENIIDRFYEEYFIPRKKLIQKNNLKYYPWYAVCVIVMITNILLLWHGNHTPQSFFSTTYALAICVWLLFMALVGGFIAYHYNTSANDLIRDDIMAQLITYLYPGLAIDPRGGPSSIYDVFGFINNTEFSNSNETFIEGTYKDVHLCIFNFWYNDRHVHYVHGFKGVVLYAPCSRNIEAYFVPRRDTIINAIGQLFHKARRSEFEKIYEAHPTHRSQEQDILDESMQSKMLWYNSDVQLPMYYSFARGYMFIGMPASVDIFSIMESGNGKVRNKMLRLAQYIDKLLEAVDVFELGKN